MKLKHKYTMELGSMFMKMSDDEYIEWLKTNEVEYQKPLLQLVLESKNELNNNEE